MAQIRVTPEDLHISAMKIEGHAEELHVRHASSDSRIADAEPGVPMMATAALATATAKWQLDTTVLHGQLSAHSQAMSGAASAFTEAEAGNTSSVEAVGGQAGAIAADL